jgi:hypothetical protein
MKKHALGGLVGIGICAAAFAACGGGGGGGGGGDGGSAGTGNAGGTGAAGGTTGSTTTSGSGGSDVECPAPEPAHPGEVSTVDSVKAEILDTKGAPATGILADVCGTNLCLTGGADANGDLLVTDTTDKQLSDLRLLYGDGLGFVRMGTPLPGAPGTNLVVDLGTIHAVRLADPTSGAPLVAGSPATNNGVTLLPPANATFDISGIIYEENERGFRAAVFKPSDGTFPAVENAPVELALLIGMAPIESTICPAAKLTFPNSEGWAAGAEVELWLNGVVTFDHWAPFGGWAKLAEAVVDGDGKTVTTKDGQGIVHIGTWGAKLK